MVRSTFCLAALVFAQVLPTGCPTTGGPDNSPDNLPARGTIPTSATSESGAVEVGESVPLLAAASTDGGAVSYNWVQVSGAGVKISGANSARASFTAPSLKAEQRLRFMVTTTDDAGNVGSAAVEVLIAPDPKIAPDVPAVARAGADQVVGGGSVVTLSGSSSLGLSLSYSWVQTSGTPTVTLGAAQSALANFTAPAFVEGADNRFGFELTVTDTKGRVSRDTVTVAIRNPALSPKPRVRIKTNATGASGDIVLELDDVKAPISVANFLRYVDEGYFDGTIFHRVVKDFVIQGGQYLPDLSQKDEHEPIVLEKTGLSNVRGSLALARTSDPNSGSAQFYINLKDNSAALDPRDGFEGYAVFGTVIEGLDVVDTIGNAVVSERGFPPDTLEDVPVIDIIMVTVRREP